MAGETLEQVFKQLERIEAALTTLVEGRAARDYYSTGEVAKMLGRAEYTVREWCRLGRIRALKRRSGRGRYLEWMVPHEELTRLRNEGLLPAEDGADR